VFDVFKSVDEEQGMYFGLGKIRQLTFYFLFKTAKVLRFSIFISLASSL
jgi:hypothetical protein